MRVRVSFEYQAGVCLWADDAEARARWTSAIAASELDLPAGLAHEANALMARWDAAFDPADPAAGPRCAAEEEVAFQARVSAWTDGVRAALSLAGVELVAAVVPAGSAASPAEQAFFEGEVIVCFTDEEARGGAAAKFLSDYAWRESATWAGNGLPYRESERTPEALLTALEAEPGFVIGWWQERDGGAGDMLAGDPVEHAISCVRERNATGLANFLSWESVRRVHLGEALATAVWLPAKQHRLASERGGVWEWWSFFRDATAALNGRGASERYKNAERDRLWWKWTHGGSRGGWPATFGEAFERIGLRRERFARWVK